MEFPVPANLPEDQMLTRVRGRRAGASNCDHGTSRAVSSGVYESEVAARHNRVDPPRRHIARQAAIFYPNKRAVHELGTHWLFRGRHAGNRDRSFGSNPPDRSFYRLNGS